MPMGMENIFKPLAVSAGVTAGFAKDHPVPSAFTIGYIPVMASGTAHAMRSAANVKSKSLLTRETEEWITDIDSTTQTL